MFGVLVGVRPDGTRAELRAFSGMLNGRPFAPGFVGPTRPGGPTAAAERATLAALTALGREIEAVDVGGAQRALARARARFDHRIDELVAERRRQKQVRAAERARLRSDDPVDRQRRAELVRISQREGARLRALRGERRGALQPLETIVARRRARRDRMRAERRRRSRALQAAMHASHGLVNFAGRYARLEQLFPATGIPTGTGECCAPKLLHEAALRGIRPSGLAEFWWGPPPAGGGREHTRFHPPCAEKCAPLLGHLLCGLDAPQPPLEVLYEDDDLLAIDKPAGLLSVPGRTSATADCVETRLALLRPEEGVLRAAHRLDQATSGVLIVARSEESYRRLAAAFAAGRAEKEYRARVAGPVRVDAGEIRLPLRADPAARPRQVVDHAGGRAALTRFRVLARSADATDLLLRPTTGRTHQLRVHCAHPEGLGTPIVGDALYGAAPGPRLVLHAWRLRLPHPRTGRPLELCAPLPDWAARSAAPAPPQYRGLRSEKKRRSAFP